MKTTILMLIQVDSDHESQFSTSEDDEADEVIEIEQFDRSDLREIPFEEFDVDQWVKVSYEEEIFLGKVLQKKGRAVMVRCLDKPYGNVTTRF